MLVQGELEVLVMRSKWVAHNAGKLYYSTSLDGSEWAGGGRHQAHLANAKVLSAALVNCFFEICKKPEHHAIERNVCWYCHW